MILPNIAMQLIVQDNVIDVLRYVDQMQASVVPLALAKALTFTAEAVKDAEYAEMQRVFDKPAKYTLNSLAMKPATQSRLKAEVFFKAFGGTPASNYLTPHIRGGGRGQKRSEKALQRAGLMGNAGYWVPGGGAQLSPEGNIKGSRMSAILSYLKASTDALQNRTARSSKRKRKSTWFVPPIGHRLKPGVYRREGDAIKPELIFVNAVHYQRRFHFYDLADRVARATFPDKWEKSLARERARLRPPQ